MVSPETDTSQHVYDESDIQALEGLMPVRKRPGMYIGSTGKSGLHHLIWEVVDNSVDEAMQGRAKTIGVTLNDDNSVTVTDDGSGIPVKPQQRGSYKGMPTIEMVFTVLHAGGKFDSSAYAFSGGLHGVGISVVNALSERTTATVYRDGKEYRITFGNFIDEDGNLIPGKTLEPLQEIGPHDGPTGTSVTFLPDETVFTTTIWDSEAIKSRLRQAAFTNPGLHFTFQDNREVQGEVIEYEYPNGIRDFMDELTDARLEQSESTEKRDQIVPQQAIYMSGVDEENQGEWELCMKWFPDTWYRVNSYANSIYTRHGGTHVKGFEQVLTQIINKYARQDHIRLLGPQDPNLEAPDVRSGLGVIISVKVTEPEFVGQTKDELSNDETRRMVRSGFSAQFWDWMEQNPLVIKEIIKKAVFEMRLRYKRYEAENAERNKQEKRGFVAKTQPLPEKLSDCRTKDRYSAELFIIEGDSAGGTTKKGRNSDFQACLPIRGKGLNIENAMSSRNGRERIENNKEIQGIIASLGTGSQDNFDLSARRYGKVIILADADDDGKHITALIMTSFYRLMREYVEAGCLYVARPPLFGTTYQGQKIYVHNMAEREQFEAEHPNANIEWGRFKGLGEMNQSQLRETALDPTSRHVIQITVDDLAQADQTITELMGRDSGPKWELMQSAEIDEDDVSV